MYEEVFEDLMVETVEILYGNPNAKIISQLYEIMTEHNIKKNYGKERDKYIDDRNCFCFGIKMKSNKKFKTIEFFPENYVQFIIFWSHIGTIIMTTNSYILCFIAPDEDYINLAHSYIYNDICLWLKKRQTNNHILFQTDFTRYNKKICYLFE